MRADVAETSTYRELIAGRIGRVRLGMATLAALALGLGACGGDDGDDQDKQPPPLGGNYVGQVEGKGPKAFVAVVAAPPQKGKDSRAVSVYVCDGERLCEWTSGTVKGNAFVANDGAAKAKGKLSEKQASGTIELPGGETVSYKAGPAAAAAGLYELKVSADGKFSGASSSGVALKGDSTLPKPGSGSLKLADGERLKFRIKRASGELGRLQAGQVRLIVLPDGKLAGAGKNAGGGGGQDSGFLLRSSD